MHLAVAAVGGRAGGLLVRPRAGAPAAHEHVDEAQLQVPVRDCCSRQVVLCMQSTGDFQLQTGCARRMPLYQSQDPATE